MLNLERFFSSTRTNNHTSETLLDKLRRPVFISTYESSIKKRHGSLGLRSKIRETTIQFCVVPLIYRGLLGSFVIIYDMVY